MIDDYSSDAYDDNAFGSDNDNDASIRTNNSGIDEAQRRRIPPKQTPNMKQSELMQQTIGVTTIKIQLRLRAVGE